MINRKTKIKFLTYFAFISIFLIAWILVKILLPHYNPLIIFCFYTAISNFFIPWMPHEPAVMFFGTLFSPLIIALAGGISTCWIEFFNYEILRFITDIEKVQNLTSKEFYKKVERFFVKIPFLALIVAGFTPVPFAPFRVLSVTSKYHILKYLLSVFVGRTSRYYILAFTGAALDLPIWSYGFIFLVFLFIGLWSKFGRKRYKNNKLKNNDDGENKMCLAIPGKIINIDGEIAEIEISGIIRKASLQLVPEAKVGDYAIVHAGFAIEVLDEDSAKETLALLESIQ